MYDELIKRLRETPSDWPDAELHYEAANAIENTSKAYQMMAEAYEAEVTKPRWIPVTERLPQEWWPVLGLIQYHDEKEPPSQQVLWYLGNGHWRETWRGDMIESDVTHWMPLPQPPKEEK